MRTNAQLLIEPDDKIAGAFCTVDGAPILRFGDVSVMLTWDQLHKVHSECIKLTVTRHKDAA
jgi:hypothetical protein